MKSKSLSITFLSRKRLRGASTESERVAFNLALLIGRERIDIQKWHAIRLSFLFDATHYFAPSNSISNCGMNISILLSNQQYQ